MSTTQYTQYTSIHSGVDIDRAVSYYKSLDTYGRTILSVPVTTEDWIKIEDEDINNGLGILFDEKPSEPSEGEDVTEPSEPTEPSEGEDVLVGETKIYKKKANNYIKIKLTGTYKLGGAPLVYFVDNNGQQWYVDHIFTPMKTDGTFDPSNIQYIYCLSNAKIAGAIVITCNLTDIKTINEDGTESSISVSNDNKDVTEPSVPTEPSEPTPV